MHFYEVSKITARQYDRSRFTASINLTKANLELIRQNDIWNCFFKIKNYFCN